MSISKSKLVGHMKSKLSEYIKTLRGKLTGDVLKAMLKNTLPPTAALCVIQSTTLYDDFDTIGYLPVIITIIEAPMLDRVPFMKNMLFTCILNCVAVSIGLLAGYCSTQARLHTMLPGDSLSMYNSSASVVSAIWLVFIVWALQTFRAYNPQHLTPVIIATIFSIVSIVTSTRLTDMRSITNFNIQLLESFFLAHGFSTATNLLIFPKTSRSVVLDDIQKFLQSARDVATRERSFLHTLSSMLGREEDVKLKQSSETDESEIDISLAKEFQSVKDARTLLSQQFTKLQADLSTAKRDIGWSGLTTADLKQTVAHLRNLMLCLRGIAALGSVFKNICAWRKWDLNFEDDDNSDMEPKELVAGEITEQLEWKAIFSHAAELLSSAESLVTEGLDHASICLKQSDDFRFSLLFKCLGLDKHTKDMEKSNESLAGGRNFISPFVERVDHLKNQIGDLLQSWKEEDVLERTETREASFQRMLSHEYQPHVAKYEDSYYREQQQLFVILYIENLLRKVLQSLEEVVLHADECKIKVDTQGKSLILPGKRTLWKLASKMINDENTDLGEGMVGDEQLPLAPRLPGSSRSTRNGFEHLPPTTIAQRLGYHLTSAYHVIGSHQSFHGFRVACAVLSVTLIAFLGPTQAWFFNRRGLWSAIFIPFSMAPSSGEAFTLLIYRLTGTVLALVLALLNWYMADGVPAGVIIWFFVITFVQQYFLVKYPQYGPLWRPSIITRAVIIGFELQIQHTNVPQPPATETQAYPVYLIGPYRFACVVIGVTVAFIWTIFPHPISTGSIMRKRLGAAMFTLAEYHSCMHSAIMSWERSLQMHMNQKGDLVASAEHFTKAQNKLFSRGTNLLTLIRSQANFSRFEPNIGGPFPEQHYKAIVREIDLFMSYMNMVIFTATSIPIEARALTDGKLQDQNTNSTQWTTGLIDLSRGCRSASARVTTLLCLLASSVANQQPLPPDLRVPEPFYVAQQLRKSRPELMDLGHATEAGYGVFAVIEVSTTMITLSLKRLLEQIKDLAGELNFETTGTSEFEDVYNGKKAK